MTKSGKIYVLSASLLIITMVIFAMVFSIMGIKRYNTDEQTCKSMNAIMQGNFCIRQVEDGTYQIVKVLH